MGAPLKKNLQIRREEQLGCGSGERGRQDGSNLASHPGPVATQVNGSWFCSAAPTLRKAVSKGPRERLKPGNCASPALSRSFPEQPPSSAHPYT